MAQELPGTLADLLQQRLMEAADQTIALLQQENKTMQARLTGINKANGEVPEKQWRLAGLLAESRAEAAQVRQQLEDLQQRLGSSEAHVCRPIQRPADAGGPGAKPSLSGSDKEAIDSQYQISCSLHGMSSWDLANGPGSNSAPTNSQAISNMHHLPNGPWSGAPKSANYGMALEAVSGALRQELVSQFQQLQTQLSEHLTEHLAGMKAPSAHAAVQSITDNRLKDSSQEVHLQQSKPPIKVKLTDMQPKAGPGISTAGISQVAKTLEKPDGLPTPGRTASIVGVSHAASPSRKRHKLIQWDPTLDHPLSGRTAAKPAAIKPRLKLSTKFSPYAQMAGLVAAGSQPATGKRHRVSPFKRLFAMPEDDKISAKV
ncbi:hypothetical protein WJX74_008276 [Apatococcus lobatus]|uniref:Uncharacterized protein n=1 Tax=Apatococcus lobatus TaxID=904363 RepID=A0AAW1RCC0_9CHLO